MARQAPRYRSKLFIALSGIYGVDALIVRVCALRRPVTIEGKEDYAGCKSWVDLDEDVAVAGAVPVLTDEAFADRRAAIKKALCTAHGTSE